jgi:hypothetical protein
MKQVVPWKSPARSMLPYGSTASPISRVFVAPVSAGLARTNWPVGESFEA